VSLFDDDVTREELHFRQIDMRGYRRSDGLFEVQGTVTDRKPYDLEALDGGRSTPAHEPIHDMGVRLVFDADLTVRAVQTFTAAAPYRDCPEGGRALQALVGVRMVSGWSRTVRSLLGGATACTHLMELLIPLGTVAHQSLSFLYRSQPERVDADGRPLKIDSCYAYGAERELVRLRWPRFHRQAPSDSD
jgi:hypothetical protein